MSKICHCCWHRASWIIFILLVITVILNIMDMILLFRAKSFQDFINHRDLFVLVIAIITTYFLMITLQLMCVYIHYEIHSCWSFFMILLFYIPSCAASAYLFYLMRFDPAHKNHISETLLPNLWFQYFFVATTEIFGMLIYTSYFCAFREFYNYYVSQAVKEAKENKQRAKDAANQQQQAQVQCNCNNTSTFSTQQFQYETYGNYQWAHLMKGARESLVDADKAIIRAKDKRNLNSTNSTSQSQENNKDCNSEQTPRNLKVYMVQFGANIRSDP